MRLKIIAGAACAALMCIMAACAPSANIGQARAQLLASDETRVVVSVTAGDETKSLYDVLSDFAQRGEISMEGSTSEYGFYITSVNGTASDAEHFWAVYTTLGTYDGVSYSDAQYGTWEYEGRELASASYGVSGLPLVEGELYALVFTSIS